MKTKTNIYRNILFLAVLIGAFLSNATADAIMYLDITSPDFRKVHPEIPWRAIVGMRHKVVHDYMDVDEDVVWETADREIKPLVSSLKAIPAESGS